MLALLLALAPALLAADPIATATATPEAVQSTLTDSTWNNNGPDTEDVLFFIGLLLLFCGFGYFLYRWTVRRRAAAVASHWQGQGQYAPGPQGEPVSYPPPPLYAQPSYERVPDTDRDLKPPGLSRALSTTSTASTLIGKDTKDKHRSEDDELEMPVLTNPTPAHKSSWRGRFGRLGDSA